MDLFAYLFLLSFIIRHDMPFVSFAGIDSVKSGDKKSARKIQKCIKMALLFASVIFFVYLCTRKLTLGCLHDASG